MSWMSPSLFWISWLWRFFCLVYRVCHVYHFYDDWVVVIFLRFVGFVVEWMVRPLVVVDRFGGRTIRPVPPPPPATLHATNHLRTIANKPTNQQNRVQGPSPKIGFVSRPSNGKYRITPYTVLVFLDTPS